MAHFPLFVDLKNKNVIVIGGGKVAYRKVLKILQFEAKITIVAPKLCDELEKLLQRNQNLTYKKKKVDSEDLKDAFIVISATNDNAINQEVSSLCKHMNIPINSVDDMDNCTFLFPALIKKDSLVIGCSTSGKAPDVAAYVKNLIEQSLPGNIDQVIDILGQLRSELKKVIFLQKTRSQIIHNLLEYCVDKKFNVTYDELYQKMNTLITQVDGEILIK